jgi:hypothetical protein
MDSVSGMMRLYACEAVTYGGISMASGLWEAKARRILQYGVAIDAVDSWGTTALMQAIGRDRACLVELLLRSDADTNFSGGNRPPLVLAARVADVGVVRSLLAGGADLKLTDGEGDTGIHRAIEREDAAVGCGSFRLQLTARKDSAPRCATGSKDDMDWVDNAGRTALSAAIVGDALEM